MKFRTILTLVLLLAVSTAATAAQKRTKRNKRNRRNNAAALAGSRTEVYKTVGDVRLKMFLYQPKNHKAGDNRPAVVFFFGGGWRAGSPAQFGRHCRYLASRGMVAMTADYRVEGRHKVKAVKCVADAKSAIRWVRANAKRLGIDPDRIAAGGGSAGGHLAAAVATLDGFNETGENTSVSARPNALLLFNPALNLTPKGFHAKPDGARMLNLQRRFGTDPKNLSPSFHVKADTPPTIIFHGKADTTVPYSQAEEFAAKMKNRNNRCELAGYEGQTHGFFNFGRNGNKPFIATLKRTDRFLVSLGYLKSPDTVDAFMKSLGKQAKTR